MHRKWSAQNIWLRRGVEFLVLTLVFAVAYTQSPLFTSNQNQYFLHGFAQAGVGYLDQDWLANTLDPTPVFSLIVTLTQGVSQSGALYYIYYALLMGVYLLSLLGIVSSAFDVRSSRGVAILYLSLLILVHSAALRFALSRTLGVNWTYILEDGVADQRLLGSVFQPSTFGVLLVFSIYLFLRHRPYLAVLSAAIAATVHPTYLLSAAVLTLAYMLLVYREERRLTKPLLLGGFALLAVAPVLIYVFSSFGESASETARRAQAILVNVRIPHHARIDWWFDATAVVKIFLVMAAIVLVRSSRRLFTILLTLFLAATGLTTLQWLLDSSTLALIFPWRLSTFLVPISTALILAYLVSALARRYAKQFDRHQNAIMAAGLIVICLTVIVGLVRLKLDFERKITGPERPMMDFVTTNKKPGELYLTPVKMQGFRLVTGAPVFVDFKSIPYRNTDVLEWRRRVVLADTFYKGGDCAALEQLAGEYGVTHIVIDLERSNPTCPQLALIYEDDHFLLYEFLKPGSLLLPTYPARSTVSCNPIHPT